MPSIKNFEIAALPWWLTFSCRRVNVDTVLLPASASCAYVVPAKLSDGAPR